MKESIRIVSDGTPTGTAVYSADGERLKGVMSVQIHPIDEDHLVTATITFVCVGLDVVALQAAKK